MRNAGMMAVPNPNGLGASGALLIRRVPLFESYVVKGLSRGCGSREPRYH